MPKSKEAESSRVIRYFSEAHLEAAQAVLGIVQGIMKERRGFETKPPKPFKALVPRAKKTDGVAAAEPARE